jgi:DNA-directed RNA polymerase subunit RPC12/RpoP
MVIETLGDAFTHSVTVELACAEGKGDGLKKHRECIFRHQLDMMTLVCTRGRDFPIAMLKDRMRCPRCGSRKVRILFNVLGNGDRRQGAGYGR